MIRQAQTIDIERLVPLGLRFFAEANLPGQFNPAFFEQVWEKILVEGLGEIWVYEDKEEILGSIGGTFSPSITTGEKVAQEGFWFVMPEARGHAGLKLFHTFIDRAKENGCSRIIMTTVCSSPTYQGLTKFFLHTLKGTPLEVNYLLEI